MTSNYLISVEGTVGFPLSQSDCILVADLYNKGLTIQEAAETLIDKLETV